MCWHERHPAAPAPSGTNIERHQRTGTSTERYRHGRPTGRGHVPTRGPDDYDDPREHPRGGVTNPNGKSTMAEITAAEIRRLRELTGAGMSDVKKALVEHDGDFEKAKAWLREKGLAGVAKRAGRSASNGMVESYLHRTDPALPPTIGVLVELRCETDFVAKTDQFKQLGKDIAQHIAAADPLYVRPEDIPNEVLEQEKKIYEAAAREEGKPEQALPKIVEGRVNGYVKQVALLEQPWVRDTKVTIKRMLEDAGASLGEKIEIGRFARFNVKAV